MIFITSMLSSKAAFCRIEMPEFDSIVMSAPMLTARYLKIYVLDLQAKCIAVQPSPVIVFELIH